MGTVPPRFYNPKTKAGYRELPLPAELVSTPRTWKLAAPVSSDDSAFGHPTDGGPLKTIVHRPQGDSGRPARARVCDAARSEFSDIATHPVCSPRVHRSRWCRRGWGTRMRRSRCAPTATSSRATDSGEADRYAAGFLKSAKGNVRHDRPVGRLAD